MFGVLWSLSPNRNPCHGWNRGWLLQVSLKFILLIWKVMRAHSVTFSMLACHGKGWWTFTKAAFLSLLRHNLPSKVRLRNNQTARNVYCGCNNSDTFRQSYFHVSFLRRMPATLIWPRQSIGGSCQTSEMATLLNSLSFVFKISFQPKYRVIILWLYCKVVQWGIMSLVSLDSS